MAAPIRHVDWLSAGRGEAIALKCAVFNELAGFYFSRHLSAVIAFDHVASAFPIFPENASRSLDTELELTKIFLVLRLA